MCFRDTPFDHLWKKFSIQFSLRALHELIVKPPIADEGCCSWVPESPHYVSSLEYFSPFFKEVVNPIVCK